MTHFQRYRKILSLHGLVTYCRTCHSTLHSTADFPLVTVADCSPEGCSFRGCHVVCFQSGFHSERAHAVMQPRRWSTNCSSLP